MPITSHTWTYFACFVLLYENVSNTASSSSGAANHPSSLLFSLRGGAGRCSMLAVATSVVPTLLLMLLAAMLAYCF
jgi:hypothetical protein